MRDGYFEGSPELGAAIKNRWEELGLTVAEAARAADISTQTWKKYESGWRKIPSRFPYFRKMTPGPVK
ncbi:MAG: helix-turn-helix domain-containing protein [Acutalibacteraceae bacterium]